MTSLLEVAEYEGIEIHEIDLPERIKGLYYDKSIAINICVICFLKTFILEKK